MIEQKVVRTYDRVSGYTTTNYCCTELSKYLEHGWKVVFITPRPDYTEYIIEGEVDSGRMD